MTIREVADKMVQVYQQIQHCVVRNIVCDELRDEYARLNREWNRLYLLQPQ